MSFFEKNGDLLIKFLDLLSNNKKEDTMSLTENNSNIETVVSVRVPGAWSDFKYLFNPEASEMNSLGSQTTFYFAIPSGYSASSDFSLTYKYYTFPFNGSYLDSREYEIPLTSLSGQR